MPHPLATRIVSADLRESQRRFAASAQDLSLPWEEVSRQAGEDCRRILALMEGVDQVVERFVEDNTNQALATGIRMFSVASKTVDPDFIPDLAEGVSALVARVRQQAEQGRLLPMNYMDPATRKQLFLIETYLSHS